MPNRYLSRLWLIAGLWMLGAQSALAQNYSDIWWNPAESGWGVTIADHESQLFVVWYTYRSDGKPVWYVAPGGTFSGNRTVFQGELYVTDGPPFSAAAFDSTQVHVTRVGSITINFAPAGEPPGSATFSYSLQGVTQSKVIQRQPFGNASPDWGHDFTDIYYNPDESGWGLTLAQHGNNVFGVWYTYDANRDPVWFVLPGATFSGSRSFSGTLYQTRGPYFATAPFDPAAVSVTPAGSATITFPAATTLKADASLCFGQSASFKPTIGSSSRTLSACVQPFGKNPFETQAPAGTLNPKTCRGTGTITLTGILDTTNCPQSLNLTVSTAVTIDNVDWTKSGDQEAYISIEKGVWLCDFPTHSPRADKMFWFPTLPVAVNGAEFRASYSVPPQPPRTYDGTIGLRVNGRSVTSTQFQAHDTYPPWGKDYRWSGSFSCTVDP